MVLAVEGPLCKIPILVRQAGAEWRAVSVEVRVDGQLRLRRRLGAPGVWGLEVPLLPSESDTGRVRIELEVDRVHVPATLGRGTDTRPLGMALSVVEFPSGH